MRPWLRLTSAASTLFQLVVVVARYNHCRRVIFGRSSFLPLTSLVSASGASSLASTRYPRCDLELLWFRRYPLHFYGSVCPCVVNGKLSSNQTFDSDDGVFNAPFSSLFSLRAKLSAARWLSLSLPLSLWRDDPGILPPTPTAELSKPESNVLPWLHSLSIPGCVS